MRSSWSLESSRLLSVCISSQRRSSRSRRASSCRSTTSGRSIRSCYGEQLLSGGDHGGSVAEGRREALLRAGTALEHLDMAFCTQMGQGDSRELGRCVGEDADARAACAELPQNGAHVCVPPEIDRRALLCEPLQQLSPVRQLLVQLVDVDAEAAACVFEPVAPERLGVAERRKADRDRLHRSRSRSQRSIPAATPTASIATSTGDACRPRTKCWCSSSVAAYAMPAASASASLSSAR